MDVDGVFRRGCTQQIFMTQPHLPLTFDNANEIQYKCCDFDQW